MSSQHDLTMIQRAFRVVTLGLPDSAWGATDTVYVKCFKSVSAPLEEEFSHDLTLRMPDFASINNLTWRHF